MKEIKAIVQSSMLENVLRTLHGMKGLPGCTVSQVCGYQKSGAKSDEWVLEHEERAKIEIVVRDSDAKRVAEAIAKNARTGSPGDGKIFVLECSDAIHIRTGRRGESAL